MSSRLGDELLLFQITTSLSLGSFSSLVLAPRHSAVDRRAWTLGVDLCIELHKELATDLEGMSNSTVEEMFGCLKLTTEERCSCCGRH